jgi:hypothetical protein
MLSEYVLDSLEAKSNETQVGAGDVEKMLATASGLAWEKAESGIGVHASALTVHGLPCI